MIKAVEPTPGMIQILGADPAEPVHLDQALKERLISATRIAFERCRVSSAVLDYLIQVNQAVGADFGRLALAHLTMSNDMLKQIGQMTYLHTVILNDPVNKTFKPNVMHLEGMPYLRSLRFGGMMEFPDPALERLTRFAKLESLQVAGSKLTGAGLQALRKNEPPFSAGSKPRSRRWFNLRSLWLDQAAELKLECLEGVTLPRLDTLGLIGSATAADLYTVDWAAVAPKLGEIWMDPDLMSEREAKLFEAKHGIAICFPAYLEDLSRAQSEEEPDDDDESGGGTETGGDGLRGAGDRLSA